MKRKKKAPIRETHAPLYVWVKKTHFQWVHDEAASRGLSASKYIDFWIAKQIAKAKKKAS